MKATQIIVDNNDKYSHKSVSDYIDLLKQREAEYLKPEFGVNKFETSSYKTARTRSENVCFELPPHNIQNNKNNSAIKTKRTHDNISMLEESEIIGTLDADYDC